MRKLIIVFCLLMASQAHAGKANVIAAKVFAEAGETFRFEVTILSDDTGWGKYADRWEVLAPDGTVLGTRILAHPHETEQPFTRDLSGVKIPGSITKVQVRAHDSVEGFGGEVFAVTLP